VEALETIEHDVEPELDFELVVATRADHRRLLMGPAGRDGSAC
jgi:hypothetical protein